MLNRTKFIKLLENLKLNSHSIITEVQGIRTDEFNQHLDKSIKILKEYDEEWKKEQETIPTLQVFIQEQTQKDRGHYTFEIKGKNSDKTHTFSDNDIYLLENSRLMTEYVVISSEVKKTEVGFFVDQANWGYPKYLCKITIDKADNYENVRTEAN